MVSKMSSQQIRDVRLKKVIEDLLKKLAIPASQATIRTEVISAGELNSFQNGPYAFVFETDSNNLDLEFRSHFDFNGPENLIFLASLRQVGLDRIVLDMAIEVGFLTEAAYRRYLGQIDSQIAVRPSVALQFSEGRLIMNGQPIGSVQQRTPHTQLQTILQMFQDQDWPGTISVPERWESSRVKRVCRQLRKRFEGHLSFHEAQGGRSIRSEIVGQTNEVTPN